MSFCAAAAWDHSRQITITKLGVLRNSAAMRQFARIDLWQQTQIAFDARPRIMRCKSRQHARSCVSCKPLSNVIQGKNSATCDIEEHAFATFHARHRCQILAPSSKQPARACCGFILTACFVWDGARNSHATQPSAFGLSISALSRWVPRPRRFYYHHDLLTKLYSRTQKRNVFQSTAQGQGRNRLSFTFVCLHNDPPRYWSKSCSTSRQKSRAQGAAAKRAQAVHYARNGKFLPERNGKDHRVMRRFWHGTTEIENAPQSLPHRARTR